jgi:transcription initiation factor TFIIIB Brf1 subunit/transcription initiation factor TFIIB
MKKCPHCNSTQYIQTREGKVCKRCGYVNSQKDGSIKRYGVENVGEMQRVQEV